MNLEAISTAQREREYSPSSVIGGHYQPYLQAYAQRSTDAHALALAMGARWQRLAYGSAPSQGIDLYLPPGPAASQALLLFVHGGYWQELSAADSRFPAAACLRAGHAFAALDYTLAPAATLDAIVQECRSAWASLSRQAPSLGLDPQRMVVSGSSAGAHLAAMLCLPGSLPEDLPPPAAALLVSGIYRLEPLIGTSINLALRLDGLQCLRNSPQQLTLTGFPPSLVCWGQQETNAFKAQSLHFAGALALAGTASHAVEIAGRNHFDIILDLAEPGTVLGDATLAALSGRHFPAAATPA